MKIKELYFYPIKSLRGISVSSALLTPQGIAHDRRFMLCKVNPSYGSLSAPNNKSAEPLQNMTVTYFPQMGLFTQNIRESGSGRERLHVTFHNPSTPNSAASPPSIAFLLAPQSEELQEIDVSLHGSPTKAFVMEHWVCKWFSACFGWEVVLVYMPEGTIRPVLGNLAPSKATIANDKPVVENGIANGWFSTFTNFFPGHSASAIDGQKAEEDGITFADCAPYLVVTDESLKDVSARLPNGSKADITKFRPNIVLEGAGKAYEEDFWGAISILSSEGNNSTDSIAENTYNTRDHGRLLDITLTQNCLRCQSLDIDYETGTYFKSVEGTVLKKLMRDRRVDAGKKWSPVFGRYGFLHGKDERTASIGDEVVIKRRNAERTTFCKFLP
ncbi:MAG: hypothetical protein Q9218_003014 [Villophora microphyllina]